LSNEELRGLGPSRNISKIPSVEGTVTSVPEFKLQFKNDE